MRDGGPSCTARLHYAYHRATTRAPRPRLAGGWIWQDQRRILIDDIYDCVDGSRAADGPQRGAYWFGSRISYTRRASSLLTTLRQHPVAAESWRRGLAMGESAGRNRPSDYIDFQRVLKLRSLTGAAVGVQR